MPQPTNIEWTDFTANPLKYRDRESGKVVWACVKHSAGCAHCYAEAIALRFDRGGPFTKAAMEKAEPFLDEKEVKQLLRSPKLAGKKVFIGDMTDIFGEWVPDELLDRLFCVFALRSDVTFQVLTKRADRMRDYLKKMDEEPLGATIKRFAKAMPIPLPCFDDFTLPLPNVWIGVSVENQVLADTRIPCLLETPAAIRFLSCEPLLGPVDFRRVPGLNKLPAVHVAEGRGPAGVDWVIVGGESGADARRMDVAWARQIVAQCKGAGVPVFVKQLGTRPHTLACQKPNCSDDACRVRLKLSDRKGGNPSEWPAELQFREFPTVEAHA